MTHYRMLDRAPSAIITSNKNELKIYQGNVVYLNDGDNFELKFFNPTMEKIGVEIIFNGLKKGNSLLVLNPGQDITLDRFLDEQRKMVFETYNIDGNNKAAVESIQQNGLITFNFYKEYFSTPINVEYNFPPKPYKKCKKNKKFKIGITGTTGCQGNAGRSNISGNSGHVNYTSSNFINPGLYFQEFDQSNSNTRTYSSVDFNSVIETGRIEKGSASNQTMTTVNVQFSSQYFHTISYKLLPYSQMNKTTKEIRSYCTECGYRLRKDSWKYCPKCGEKLN